MKKTVFVKDFCCSRCTKQLEEKLAMYEGVLRAKTNFQKNLVLLEVKNGVSDEEIAEIFAEQEIEIAHIENRKGIFG